MTIEEKAKRYDEAINAIKELKSKHPTAHVIKDWIKENFPELVESEDEKIRKALIHLISEQDGFLTAINGISVKDILAWLEKQVKQKPFDYENATIVQQDFALKVEPKFNRGEWIVDNCGNVWKIEGILNQFYILEGAEGSESRPTIEWVDKTFHLWTIQDAKDGDVISYVTDEEALWIMIYWSLYEPYEGHVHYHALLVNNKFSDKGTCCINIDNLKPATKEQCDALMKAMDDAGYTFDFEKKELKEIVYNGKHKSLTVERAKEMSPFMRSGFEQKTAWSEEDEKIRQTIINEFEQCSKWCCANGLTKEDCIAWLNRQIHAKWSEEDKKKVNNLYVLLDQMVRFNMLSNKDASEFKDWLKSLNPQNRWKPSDEQIKTCKEVYSDLLSAKGFDIGTINSEINRLEEQLKKLESIRPQLQWKPSEEEIDALMRARFDTQGKPYHNCLAMLHSDLIKLL